MVGFHPFGAPAWPVQPTNLGHKDDGVPTRPAGSNTDLVAISPDGLMADVNEATVTVADVPREALVGTTFSGYFADPDRANRIYQLVVDQGQRWTTRSRSRNRDGTLTEVLHNTSAYRDTNRNILGAFAAARDVTTQMQA